MKFMKTKRQTRNWSDEAKRILFFADYEAMLLGSATLEPEHLLLAIEREARPLLLRLTGSLDRTNSIRREVLSKAPLRLPESMCSVKKLWRIVEISSRAPRAISLRADAVIFRAQQAAHVESSEEVRTEHLILGLLGDVESFAAKVLARRNIDAQKVMTAPAMRLRR